MSTAATATPPALRRLPLPVAEPQPALRLLTGRQGDDHDQETLALDVGHTWPSEWSADRPGGPGGAGPAGQGAAGPGDQRPLDPRPGACLPEPREWATRFVQAAVEVAAGLRPAGQLVRWTSNDVQATLARRHQIAARTGQRAGGTFGAHRARVRTVLASSPASGVLEVSAVVQDHERVRAVAMRMEGARSRWRVTAFELG